MKKFKKRIGAYNFDTYPDASNLAKEKTYFQEALFDISLDISSDTLRSKFNTHNIVITNTYFSFFYMYRAVV